MNEDFDKKLDEMSDKYGLKPKPEEPREQSAAEYYFLGISLISHTLIGLFLGYWLDSFLGTSPFGLLILFFTGFIAGFRHIWLNVK